MIKKVIAIAVLSTAVVTSVGGVADASMSRHRPKPTQSIVEIASSNGSFTTLLTAVGCADAAVGAALTSGKRYTVFAPTDAAFSKLGLNSANVCGAIPKAALTDILLYHVTEGRRFAKKVLPRKPGRTKTIETLLEQSFKVNQAGVITTTSGGTSTIVLADIAATNGVIHVIDSVLIPGADSDHRHHDDDNDSDD